MMGRWGNQYPFIQGQSWPFMSGWWWPLFGAVLIWSLIWKGLALWRAARRGENVWFVVLLMVNTIGILEILYLYIFSKKSNPVSRE